MKAHTVILFLSNIFGLNFASIVASKKWIIIFQLSIVVHGFYFSFHEKFQDFVIMHLIYFIIDTFQVDLFYFIQLVLVSRAFLKRRLQKKISDFLTMKRIVSSEGERAFFINLSILVIIRVVKLGIVRLDTQRIFMQKAMFAELILASSDFMFAYYVCCLVKDLEVIRMNLLYDGNRMTVHKIQRELLQSFWIKRDLELRYSFELFISIVYNFLQLIIALYFICMRVTFGYLKNLDGM